VVVWRVASPIRPGPTCPIGDLRVREEDGSLRSSSSFQPGQLPRQGPIETRSRAGACEHLIEGSSKVYFPLPFYDLDHLLKDRCCPPVAEPPLVRR